jgi:hypothetical protein
VKSGTSGHLLLNGKSALLRGVKALAQASATNIVNTAMENVQNRPMVANGVTVAHEKAPVRQRSEEAARDGDDSENETDHDSIFSEDDEVEEHGIEEHASDDFTSYFDSILDNGDDSINETGHASIFSEDSEVEELLNPLNTAFLIKDPEDDEYGDNDKTPVVRYGKLAKEVPPPSGKNNWGSPIESPIVSGEVGSYLDELLDDDSFRLSEASVDENDRHEVDWIERLEELLPLSQYDEFDPNLSVISKAEDHFITKEIDDLFN